MKRLLIAKVLLASALAVGAACSSGDGAPNEGTGGSASAGDDRHGWSVRGSDKGGAQTTGGTGGGGGMPEQGGGRGHPRAGPWASVGGNGRLGAHGNRRWRCRRRARRALPPAAPAAWAALPPPAAPPAWAALLPPVGAGGTVAYAPCPTNGGPGKILPFGDSITEGAKSSDDAGYRSQLFKLILAAKQKVTFTGSLTNGPTQVSGQTFPRMHEGHAGWTIDPGYSEFSGYGGISSLVPSPALNGGPHIVLLHIGANDLFPTKDGAGMAMRLDALVEKIAQDAPSALVVLAQITPVGSTNNGHTQAQVAAANAAQMTYNSKIPAIIQSHVAKGQHVIGVDMSKMPLSDLTTASVHPNDQGYAYMAGIWYAAIKDLLPQ